MSQQNSVAEKPGRSPERSAAESRPSAGPGVILGPPTLEKTVEHRLGLVGYSAEVLGEAAWGELLRTQVAEARSASPSTAPLARPLAGLLETMKAQWERNRETLSPEERARLAEPEPPRCPQCDDGEWVRVTADRHDPMFGKAVPCGCVPLARRLGWSGVPEDYRAMTLESYDVTAENRRAVDAVRRWDFRRSLLFAGETGTGKTHLAIAALGHASDHLVRGRFIPAPQFLETMRERYGDDSRGSAQQFRRSLEAERLLVLDDLGAESLTDWGVEQLTTLLDARIAAGLPTVITTNLMEFRHLARALGSRTASRLGTYGRYELGGADWRFAS